MANNTELITGHGVDAHISSFDIRAFNRAVFGTGKYIFTDAENMTVDVDVLGKLFLIKSGSCMWSGMHIRIENNETVSFVSPATTDNVYLWLHYKRDSASLVETIEFVSTTSTVIDNSLIYDKLPDDVAEAYTLFATFNFDAVNNVVKSSSSVFELVKGMSDFYKETAQKLTTQAADNAIAVANLSEEVNKTISNFKNEMLDTVYGETPLVGAYLKEVQTRTTLTLNENASNFRMLKITVGDFQALWVDDFSKNGSDGPFDMIVDVSEGDNASSVLKLSFGLGGSRDQIGFSYERTIFSRNSLGQFITERNTSGLLQKTVSVYGIGRVNANESI